MFEAAESEKTCGRIVYIRVALNLIMKANSFQSYAKKNN